MIGFNFDLFWKIDLQAIFFAVNFIHSSSIAMDLLTFK